MKNPFALNKTDLILHQLSMNFISPSPDILKLCDFCWDLGKIAAISIPNCSILELIYKNNITIRYQKSLSTINNIIFSYYNKSNNTITIFEDTIKQYFDVSNYDLFITHEFFHFLQCNNYYKLKPYKLNFLNEIGAFSFSNNFGIIR